MARKVEITVSPDKTKDLITDLNSLEHLISLQLQQGASISPPGDVVSVTVPVNSLQKLLRLLDQYHLGQKGGVSISTSEPESVVSSGHFHAIDREGVTSGWEEMASLISRSSNANTIILILTVTSGILAAVGIATNALHVVVGGMLVAPAFMPLMRISLGVVSGSSAVWKKGLIDSGLVYLFIVLSAGLTALAMKAWGTDPLPCKADYYQLTKTFFQYWTTVTPTAIIASAAAALAGAVLVITKRSSFSSGVMVGLALVPSASLVGMALVEGDTTGAANAALRWLVDIGLVLFISFLVFAVIKKTKIHRDMASY